VAVPDWVWNSLPLLTSLLGYALGVWQERRKHRSSQLGQRVKETCDAIEAVKLKACVYWTQCANPDVRLTAPEITADLHALTEYRLLCAQLDPRYNFQVFCDLDDDFAELITGGNFQSSAVIAEPHRADQIRRKATQFSVELKKRYDNP
jgi:hypothetical protein